MVLHFQELQKETNGLNYTTFPLALQVWWTQAL
jgi:hypothetical protein